MTMHAETAFKPHVVYRAYAYNGVLLYVGCAADLTKRLAQHDNQRAAWLGATRRITVQQFPDHASAIGAEYQAINDESPVFNLLGNGQHKHRNDPIVFADHESSLEPAA